MQTNLNQGLDMAMAEIASQRELFWELQQRTLKRLPQGLREAIERGEALLRDAQRQKIGSPFVLAPIESGRR